MGRCPLTWVGLEEVCIAWVGMLPLTYPCTPATANKSWFWEREKMISVNEELSWGEGDLYFSCAPVSTSLCVPVLNLLWPLSQLDPATRAVDAALIAARAPLLPRNPCAGIGEGGNFTFPSLSTQLCVQV